VRPCGVLCGGQLVAADCLRAHLRPGGPLDAHPQRAAKGERAPTGLDLSSVLLASRLSVDFPAAQELHFRPTGTGPKCWPPVIQIGTELGRQN